MVVVQVLVEEELEAKIKAAEDDDDLNEQRQHGTFELPCVTIEA